MLKLKESTKIKVNKITAAELIVKHGMPAGKKDHDCLFTFIYGHNLITYVLNDKLTKIIDIIE